MLLYKKIQNKYKIKFDNINWIPCPQMLVLLSVISSIKKQQISQLDVNNKCIFSTLRLFVVWWCLTPLSTFNNISVTSWQSVLLVEETGGPTENHRSVASHWQTLSHNVVFLASVVNWFCRNKQLLWRVWIW